MTAGFPAQPLLNKKEALVLRDLNQYVLARNPHWQVMAKNSLGEPLRCENARGIYKGGKAKIELAAVEKLEGVCGAINVSKFEKDAMTDVTLWNCFAKRVVGNKTGEILPGLKCSSLDERASTSSTGKTAISRCHATPFSPYRFEDVSEAG